MVIQMAFVKQCTHFEPILINNNFRMWAMYFVVYIRSYSQCRIDNVNKIYGSHIFLYIAVSLLGEWTLMIGCSFWNWVLRNVKQISHDANLFIFYGLCQIRGIWHPVQLEMTETPGSDRGNNGMFYFRSTKPRRLWDAFGTSSQLPRTLRRKLPIW